MSACLLYGIFATTYLALVAFMFFLHYYKASEKDYLDFFCVFSASFSLYSLVGTYDRVLLNDISYEISIIVYVTIIIGYLAFAVGYLVHSKKYREESWEANGIIRIALGGNNKYRKTHIDQIVFNILVLFVVIINREKLVSMVLEFGTGSSYVATAIRSQRTAFSGPLSLFSTFLTLFLLAFPYVRVYKTGRLRALDVFILLIQGMYSLTSGHRSTLLLMGIMCLSIYNYKVKHIKLTNLCLLGFVAMTVFVSLGHLRADNTIIGMLERLINGDKSILLVTSTGEFYNTVGTFYTYVEAIKLGNYGYNYGYTWVVDLLIFIPTFLFNNRPLPWSEQFMRDFHPEAPAGTGHGWYVLNDGYMSFGIIGVALEMLILGIALSKLYYYVRRRMNSAYIAFIFCIVLEYVFLLSRGSFLLGIKNCFLEACPFIILHNINNLGIGKLKWNAERLSIGKEVSEENI